MNNSDQQQGRGAENPSRNRGLRRHWAVKKDLPIVAAFAVCLAAFILLVMSKLSCESGGRGNGPGPGGVPANVATGLPGESNATPPAAAQSSPKPLEIVIDEKTYLVDDAVVEDIDKLVKMAQAVPANVPPPRVRIVRRPTARFLAEKNLKEALETAHVGFVVE
jgi:hypothetical protein